MVLGFPVHLRHTSGASTKESTQYINIEAYFLLIMSTRTFRYICATGGVVCSILNAVALTASGFIPPIPPSWDAEQTANHYHEHSVGMRAAAALIVFSGMFYLPFTVAIASQMRRIPNLDPSISGLEMVSGAVGTLVFTLSGLILAVASFRVERPVEITQTLNDMFWVTFSMPWPAFMIQNFAYAYAILMDRRLKPLFPKKLAWVNIIAPLLYVPAVCLPFFKSGALSWDGTVAFWIPAAAWCVQVVLDCIYLLVAMAHDPETLSEEAGTS